MKRRKIGENISLEWDRDPLRQDLWRALQLIKGDTVAGVRDLESLSERGSALAMMYLGNTLFQGRYGLKKDSVRGEQWLVRSSEAGSIEACYILAKNLEGSGRSPEAVTWFRRAADRGYPPAMFMLGLNFYSGKSSEKSRDLARDYFAKAAAAGHLYGALWAERMRNEDRDGLISGVRHWLFRIVIPFRLLLKLITYPSSDRVRR